MLRRLIEIGAMAACCLLIPWFGRGKATDGVHGVTDGSRAPLGVWNEFHSESCNLFSFRFKMDYVYFSRAVPSIHAAPSIAGWRGFSERTMRNRSIDR